MQLLNYFWNSLNLEDIPAENNWRVKELLLTLYSSTIDWREENKDFYITNSSEIVKWVEELKKLAGQKQPIAALCEGLIQQVQAIESGKQAKNLSVCSSVSAQLLELIGKYQQSEPLVYWTNFGEQIYSEYRLCDRIELLYRIGKAARILNQHEDFNSYTRVTQETQDTCNRICQWVDSYLGLKMDRVNVYESFIWKYGKFPNCRTIYLKEIGVRAGLLPEKMLNNSLKLSDVDAKAVIDWVDEKYGIELPLPQKSQLSSEAFVQPVFRTRFSRIVNQTFIWSLVGGSLFSIVFQVYRDTTNQPKLTLNEFLLRKAAVESLPINKAK